MASKTKLAILFFFCITAGLLYLWHDMAQAARFGRGRSFGSRPSYQRSAPAPTRNPAGSTTQPGQNTQQNQMTAPPAPSMGRWGGILGGFIVGGMIGSLFFGGGHGFGGIGLMDILLIGGGLMLLMRFLRARQTATQGAGAGSLFSGPSQGWGLSGQATDSRPAVPQPPALPPGFDAQEFTRGAEAIYTRLQNSWDKRDLADIHQFTSSEVFAQIEQQAQEDPEPGKTEILFVNTHVIEVRDLDGQTIVSVLYDVMLREDNDRTAKQVRELWHFSRQSDRPEDFWILEGIQQVE